MQILLRVIIPVHFHAFVILSFIHSFINLCFVCPFIYPVSIIDPPFSLFILPSIHLSPCLSICLWMKYWCLKWIWYYLFFCFRSCMQSFIYPLSIHSFVLQSSNHHGSIHFTIHPSIHLSLYPSICPFISLSIYSLYIHLSVLYPSYLSIDP